MKKQDIISLGIIALLILFAMIPLFHTGFFPIHDDEQIGRLFDLNEAIQAGHIPPRIAPNLGFGYGYPFFNFYPPLVYYIAEAFKLIGFSFIDATKIMIGIGFFLTAAFMYALSSKFFGRVAGIVCAVAYTYAPYHAVDLYVRGALPEFWTFVFLPAIFLCLAKLKENTSVTNMVLAGFASAGLILTHNLVAFMSVPFIGVFVLFLAMEEKDKKKFLLSSTLSILLALGLTSYFWLPSYFEKQYTMVDLLTTELANYNIHFVSIRQFWDSAWGYGGSILGPYDGLTFQIGKVQIIFSLLMFIFSIKYFKKDKGYRLPLVFFGLFLFSMFMAARYSKFVWDSTQPLWYIQFPWRYLLFSAFTGSFLIGGIFLAAQKPKQQIILAIIIIGLVLGINKDYFQPERFLDVGDTYYTDKQKIRFETSKLAAEYVPKGTATRKTDINTTIIDVEKDEIATSSFAVVSGVMQVTEKKDLPQKKEFIVDVLAAGELRINTYNFPGWKVLVDNKEVSYTSDNKLKLITITLADGTHNVQAIFTDTPIRKIANIVSILSAIALIGLLFVCNRFHFLGL